MANTIADKLTYLSGTKDAIKQAIIGKGVDVTDTDTFRSYADKITSIQTGGGGGTGSLVTGTKLAYSTFSTIPDEYISYLEQQTDLSHMFYGCSKLQTVSLNTRKANSMSSMFYNCEALETVSLFDTSKVLLSINAFYNCTSLTNLDGFTGLKNSLYLAYCPLLTVESVMNVINNAADVSSSKPRTLTLHQDVFNKLTQEQISNASKKGWNIAAA